MGPTRACPLLEVECQKEIALGEDKGKPRLQSQWSHAGAKRRQGRIRCVIVSPLIRQLLGGSANDLWPWVARLTIHVWRRVGYDNSIWTLVFWPFWLAPPTHRNREGKETWGYCGAHLKWVTTAHRINNLGYLLFQSSYFGYSVGILSETRGNRCNYSDKFTEG